MEDASQDSGVTHDTQSDEALALALQAEENDRGSLSPVPVSSISPVSRSTPNNNTPERSWSDWFQDTSAVVVEQAAKAAEASIIAAAIAQEKASVYAQVAKEKGTELAAQAEELRKQYDSELSLDTIFATTINDTMNGVQETNKDKDASRKKGLDFVYATENVVAMAFPHDPKKVRGGVVRDGNDINEVSSYLKKHHDGKYMIWNISEEPYDYSKFGDQVLEYKFPGHPAPPLGLLFKICTSVESWLDADVDNVAIIHCLTGKGRTAALMACILTWNGEFSGPMEALEYVADRKGMSVDQLTIPSQRRYVQYFSNMLDGVKPRSEPLLLRRIIINSVPVFGENKNKKDEEGDAAQGCCPYIQLFKGGRLISTSSPATGPKDNKSDSEDPKLELKWINASDGTVSFNVDCAVQGDILLRCRHAESTGARISMFRAAFHTGYVPEGVMRLTKAQLDGSNGNSKFDEDFFIDLIFAPIETQVVHSTVGMKEPESAKSEISQSRQKNAIGVVGPPTDSGLVIEASSADRYEMSLHRDTRFWDAISARKLKAKKRTSRKFSLSKQQKFSIGDLTNEYDDDDEQDTQYQSKSDYSTKQNSDLDLIQQLARAEEGDIEEDEEGDKIEGKNNQEKKEADGDEQVKATSTSTDVNVNSEMQALEDLEKELGLDGLNLSKGSTSYTSNAANNTSLISSASGGGNDDEDDFDDLEAYLESISKA